MSAARKLALDVLLRVADQDAFVKSTLDALAAERRLPREERAFAAELAYGVLRWQAWLDHALAREVRRGLASVAPRLLVVLRLGAYQLLRLRVADHAAVSETVELARAVGREPAARFTNAVLRALQRDGAAPPPDAATDLAGHLAVSESFPAWLVARTLDELGPDDARLALAAHNAPAPLTLRANVALNTREGLAAALAAEGVATTPTAHAPHGLHAETAFDVAASPAFREGRFSVQDEASQLVVALCAAAPGQRVLDLCAAPGGKATALAQEVAGAAGGHVDAVDRGNKRAAQLVEAARRLRLDLGVHLGDAAHVPPYEGCAGGYDLVVADAPCTGLGVLRRHPEAKWRVQPDDVARLAETQRLIASAAVASVRPGGVFVYSVCTTTPEETVDVVDHLLATRPELALERPGDALASLCDERGLLRLWPHRHGTDGFFAARFRKEG